MAAGRHRIDHRGGCGHRQSFQAVLEGVLQHDFKLSAHVQEETGKAYYLFRQNPAHGSLRFERLVSDPRYIVGSTVVRRMDHQSKKAKQITWLPIFEPQEDEVAVTLVVEF